jgi:hypothetical protein
MLLSESRLVYDPLRTVVAELFLFEKQGQNYADYDLHKRAYVRRYCLLSFKANRRVSPDKIQERENCSNSGAMGG